MVKIVKWEPIADIPSELSLKDIVYNSTGLIISLKKKESQLIVHFKRFLGFRSFAEFYRLKMVSESPVLNSPDANWSLFISEEDEFIKWIIKENYDTVDSSKKLKNYIIWTPDDIIEVISEIPPFVQWIKESTN